MVKVDFIIVGQGICGSILSYQLIKKGKTVIVIDENKNNTSSKVASGVINPVTGRRAVTTWLASEILPYCNSFYNQVQSEFNLPIISQKNILSFHVNQQREDAYGKRLEEEHNYLTEFNELDELKTFFNFQHGVTEINPIYLIEVQNIISSVKDFLIQKHSYLHEEFVEENLNVTDNEIKYRNISADKIIYCNGINSMKSCYWNKLPFVRNKGQALIVEIDNLPNNKIYKFGTTTLVPWYNNFWWVGSTYELHFFTEEPTIDFLKNTEKYLSNFLKCNFKPINHIAAVRPATIERRPFVGFHPKYKNIGILNGMGTKGCSLAPFFSNQLVNHILNNDFIHSEADVHRYTKILSL